MSSAADEFDITAPLPLDETVVLEASAGTGKTWTIAALCTRYLADGHAVLAQLLVVTFNRTAAHDLRTTIRARLVDAVASLDEVIATGITSSEHPVDRMFADEPERAPERRARLYTALGDFDAATIATIHGFCDDAAAHLGVLGDGSPRTDFVERLDDLADEVAADFYVRRFGNDPNPSFTPQRAFAIARAVAASDAEVDSEVDSQGRELDEVRFARSVREEVRRRQRIRGIHTHDDKIRFLVDTVTDKDAGHRAVVRLRQLHRIVLVDEFQDTDDRQWTILHRAFGAREHTDPPPATLVLIGDPKQSIYGFRGGDIHAYLRATRAADRTLTLTTNHRSDAPLVDALAHLLQDLSLGSDEIRVHPVRARRQGSRLRIADADMTGPLRIRSVPKTRHDFTIKPMILNDVVEDIGRMLNVTTVMEQPTETATGDDGRSLSPGDIAILVQSNADADAYCAALIEQGIPAVHAGATNVFTSEAGHIWEQLLSACEQPNSRTVRRLALTPIIGMTFADLVSADDDTVNALATRVRTWSQMASNSIADLSQALDAHGITARLLTTLGGDRLVTDLQHIGQLLHAAQRRHRLGIAGVRHWLALQRDAGAEASRRLETDADAVQIFTVHRAKGLQFPVVYAPTLWSGWQPPHKEGDPITYLGERGRRLHVTAQGESQPLRRHSQDENAQLLRIAYVAMTRAQSHLVLHWAASAKKGSTPDASRAPLHRMLLAEEGRTPERVRPRRPEGLSRVQHPGIHCAELPHVLAESADPRPVERPELSVRRWQRQLDTGWRRSSYSSLTQDVHGPGQPSELTEPSIEHADALLDDPAPSDGTIDARPASAEASDVSAAINTVSPEAVSPMADLPRGPAFGTLVHAVLEDFDPAAPDLLAELTRHCEHWAMRLPSLGVEPEELAASLLPVVETPLGPVADDLRLRDIPAHDRLPELDFEMPLAGGQHATAARPGIRLGDIADLLEDHLPADDPLVDYPAHLRAPGLCEQELRGFLTGSIDAVLRVGSPQRFLVVDYKTNWLLPPTDPGPLLLRHHTMPIMAQSMIHAHYPLQALLYSVALHRFLRWRLTDYRPDHSLGGVAYLFVRGMGGEATPVIDGARCGVFTWHPPASMIEELSDRIDVTEQSRSTDAAGGKTR